MLRIAVPPQIAAFEFADSPLNSGDAASLFCSITKGDFPIDFTWTLNGRRIGNDDNISVLRTNKRISQLSIDSIQPEHAGEYVCIAYNKAGNASHSASLQVNGISRTKRIFILLKALLLLVFPTILNQHGIFVYSTRKPNL